MGRACSKHGKRSTDVRFWWGSRKLGNHYEDVHIGGTIIKNGVLEKYDRVVWTGFIWLRIGTSEGLL
jgi:hypothetical protein